MPSSCRRAPRGTIRFEDVVFGIPIRRPELQRRWWGRNDYINDDVLGGIDVDIAPGQMVAIVGPSGASRPA